VRRQLAGWGAGAACAAAVAVAVAATRHADRTFATPIVPHGAWKQAWIVCALAALVLSGAGALLARRGALGLRAALVVAVAVQLVPLAAPVLLSQDVYLYWAEARVVTVHAADPYTVPPSRYPNDPATRIASPEWRTQTEPYGPAWVGVGALPALAAGRSAHTAELLYRILAAAGVLLLVGIVARRTRSAAAVALLGWSPLVALHYAGGAHSDALLTVFLVAAVAYGRRAAGGASWTVAAMFKAFPAVLLPLDLARDRARRPQRFWIGLVVSAVVAAAAATAVFGTGWLTTSVIAAHGSSGMGGVHFIAKTGLRHRYAVVIAALVFAVVYAVLFRRAWRHGRPHLGLAAATLCMCSSLLRPWYGLWPLALAAVEEDGLSAAAAWALSAYLLIADALPT
jgi:alpha-1,6-mannosyltransferase